MSAPKSHGLNVIVRATFARVDDRWAVTITARDGLVVTGEGASRGAASLAADAAARLAGIVSRSSRVRAREAVPPTRAVADDRAIALAAGAVYLAQIGSRPRGVDPG